jgi:hypothetical protein
MAMSPEEEPAFRLDGSRVRRRLYARAAVPLAGGTGVFAIMLMYYLFNDGGAGALVISLLGILVAVQGAVIWAGAARNPDFAIYRRRVVMPRNTPVQALRCGDFDIPVKQIKSVTAGAEDRYVFDTKKGPFLLDLMEYSSDPDRIADMRLHLNRLIDRLDGGEGNFDGNVLRKGNGGNGKGKKGRNRR